MLVPWQVVERNNGDYAWVVIADAMTRCAEHGA